MNKKKATFATKAIPWFIPLLILVLWQASVMAGWLSTRTLPSPVAVIQATLDQFANGDIWHHLFISTWRAILGFAIGGTLGLSLGLLTGFSRISDLLIDNTVQMIRTIPHLALIPLVILWFGVDESAKIFLVALGTFFPIYLNTHHGVKQIDTSLIEMGKSYDLSSFELFTNIILPGATPSILVGIRFSLGLMWLTLIVAETISSNSGIGYLAMNAREFLQTEVVVMAIIMYALLGKLADMSAHMLEKRMLKWHPTYKKEEKQ